MIIESGAVVEAARIGDYSIIEAGAKLGKGCVVGEGCKVCSLVTVPEGGEVGDGMVVWGEGWDQRRREGGMGANGEGRRVRREGVQGLGEVYRRLWTGK